jgi:hypothetical protein
VLALASVPETRPTWVSRIWGAIVWGSGCARAVMMEHVAPTFATWRFDRNQRIRPSNRAAPRSRQPSPHWEEHHVCRALRNFVCRQA